MVSLGGHMKLLLVALLAVTVALVGCSTVSKTSVRAYTFTRDRVDQRIEGNRGYIMGAPPPAPERGDIPKRTIIGIDIEVPLLPAEEARLERAKKARATKRKKTAEKKRTAAKKEAPVKKTNFEPKPEEPLVMGVVEEEEIWIK